MINLGNPAHAFILLVVFALWGALNYFAQSNNSGAPMVFCFLFWIFVIVGILAALAETIFCQL